VARNRFVPLALAAALLCGTATAALAQDHQPPGPGRCDVKTRPSTVLADPSVPEPYLDCTY
jgi:hypothetical protein